MMSERRFPEVFVGRDPVLAQIEQWLRQWEQNPAAQCCLISGIPGIGKTTLLRHGFQRWQAASNRLLLRATVTPPSTGTVAAAQLRPFGLMQSILESLHTAQQKQAKKKLWLNIGLTLLTTLPFAGDLVYAIKEISRDMREYKKETQTAANTEALQQEYCRVFQQATHAQPLVLLLDNLEWSDLESLHTLHQLFQQEPQLPLFVIAAYHQDQGEAKTIETLAATLPQTYSLTLDPLSPAAIQEWMEQVFPNCQIESAVADWIHEHTGGIPALIEELLRTLWNTVGQGATKLRVADLERSALPTSITAFVQQMLAALPEEDQYLLQLCSAEGREATVFLQSHLLGADLLTTVRRLKKLQRTTGILRSRGVERRYGIKTTVFEFTHPLYHQVLFESLEYEEQQAIFAHIEALLRDRLAACTTEAERMEILPHLWEITHRQNATDRYAAIAAELLEGIAAQGGQETFQKSFEQLSATDQPLPLSFPLQQLTEASVAELSTDQWKVLATSLAYNAEHLKTVLLQLLQHSDLGQLRRCIDACRQLPSIPDKSRQLLDLCELPLLSDTQALEQGERLIGETPDPEIQVLAAVSLAYRAISHPSMQHRIASLLQQAAQHSHHLSLPHQLLLLLAIASWQLHNGDATFHSYWAKIQHIGHLLQLPTSLLEQAVFRNNTESEQ